MTRTSARVTQARLLTKAEAAAHQWIIGGDTGASSKAIWAHMMGTNRPQYGWSYPLDPSDFGRCARLLAKIPEWRERLPEMSKRSKVWAALVHRWDDIHRAMDEEVGIDWSKAESAPKTYDLMKSIIDPARKGT